MLQMQHEQEMQTHWILWLGAMSSWLHHVQASAFFHSFKLVQMVSFKAVACAHVKSNSNQQARISVLNGARDWLFTWLPRLCVLLTSNLIYQGRCCRPRAAVRGHHAQNELIPFHSRIVICKLLPTIWNFNLDILIARASIYVRSCNWGIEGMNLQFAFISFVADVLRLGFKKVKYDYYCMILSMDDLRPNPYMKAFSRLAHDSSTPGFETFISL